MNFLYSSFPLDLQMPWELCSLLELHLQVSSGLTSRPSPYKWHNPNLQGQIPALKDALVKTSEFIYSLPYSLCIWVWGGKKKAQERKPYFLSVESILLPVLLTCFYFPRLPDTKRNSKPGVDQPLRGCKKGDGGWHFFLLKPSPTTAKHLCFLLASQQADKWSTATSQPG